jgi:hypothetical protein
MSQPKESKPSDLEAQRAVEEQLSFVLAQVALASTISMPSSAASDNCSATCDLMRLDALKCPEAGAGVHLRFPAFVL